jgi:hypothetical protein
MYLAEEEAKQKWCPFVGEQRLEQQGENCIASECMAWRIPHTIEQGDMRLYNKDSFGYCGLAGKPEE